MKKLLLFSLIISFFTNCTTTQTHKVPSYFDYAYYDYTILTKRGIFVTELKDVDFDYEILGRFHITVMGGGDVTVSTGLYDAYRNQNQVNKKFESISFEEVMDALYQELGRIRADGILDFGFRFHGETAYQGSGYTISGIAIRSKTSNRTQDTSGPAPVRDNPKRPESITIRRAPSSNR